MTVKDLISELRKYPKNKTVTIFDDKANKGHPIQSVYEEHGEDFTRGNSVICIVIGAVRK